MDITYELGPFRLNPALGVLTQAGVTQPLGARGVAVLAVLVRRANEYVSKAAIIEAAWPGLVVEESNLAVQISAIRRVLARTPGGDRWIETLARRGYRFVGPVVEGAGAAHASADRERSNLPVPLTSFVGREREVIEVKRLLSTSRLVTLTGVGGIGKTRLALQVAAEVVDAYRDGVRLVELASIADGALVPSTVAQALGIHESPGIPLVDSLCRQLKRRQLLLLLDNCEHVRSECAALSAALLRAASGVTLVATSREPLQVAGERVYALSPLSLPESGASTEAIARSEAVQLFVERSQRQQIGFALTPSRAPVVARLCSHLDGIPLALELAAARVRSLSVEQILARIDDRFRLLASGAGAAEPRQRTLRAALDWSFDLLAEDERTVLRRVSVFAGGFTVEAAAAAAVDAALDEYVVVDVLARLVARSLVNADTATAAARYHLLETTRAYAFEKLTEADEAESGRTRHARYFVDRFTRACTDWLRLSDAEWDAAYVPEIDDVRAALEWSLGNDADPELVAALAGASGPLWTTLSLHAEAVRRLCGAAALIDANTPKTDEARLRLWLAIVLEHSEPEHALASAERAAALYAELGDDEALLHSQIRVARVLTGMSRLDRASSVLAEAWPLLGRIELPKLGGLYHSTSGFLALLRGEPLEARAAYERALRLFREAGNERGSIACVGSYANVCWAMGDLDAANASFREAVTMARGPSPGMKGLLGFALGHLAAVLTERGDIAAALEAAREGVPMLAETGNAWRLTDHLALLAALAGRIDAAARVAGFADASFGARQPRESNEARARERLGRLLGEKLAPAAREQLLAEGAALSEEEACRLALGT